MSKQTTITCDGCGGFIQGNGALERNDYLILGTGQAPAEPSDYTLALAITPMLPHEQHFHNVRCLAKWLAGRLPAFAAVFPQPAEEALKPKRSRPSASR